MYIQFFILKIIKLVSHMNQILFKNHQVKWIIKIPYASFGLMIIN